jgi:hypothetical protein
MVKWTIKFLCYAQITKILAKVYLGSAMLYTTSDDMECGMWNMECGMWNMECGVMYRREVRIDM